MHPIPHSCVPSAGQQHGRRKVLAAGSARAFAINAKLRVHHASKRLAPLSAVQQESEEIDPFTGQPVDKDSVIAIVPGKELVAGGFKWRYRKIEPPADKRDASNSPVLLLHGIGSHSYSYRRMLQLLAATGFEGIAPDWLGQGWSEKPAPSKFDYSADSYIKALEAFVDASGIKKPFHLVVHGFVLGQIGMLYALQNEDAIDRMIILNTPLGLNSKLRPELAPYVNPLPFLRPGNKPFAADIYNASGSAFEMQYRDAMTFFLPFDKDPMTNTAMAQILERNKFQELLKRVDEGYQTWRKPSLLLFGAKDPFIDLKQTFEFLDTKRTNMRFQPLETKLGHMPQEDDALALLPFIYKYLRGGLDDWKPTKEIQRMGRQWDK